MSWLWKSIFLVPEKRRKGLLFVALAGEGGKKKKAREGEMEIVEGKTV